jgi:TRAP-type C4-dicarboxylate transport system permease small subunit
LNKINPILDKTNEVLNKVLIIIGSVALLSLMLIATANVIMRIAGHPFLGAYELVGFFGAVVAAFALGETQRRKDHIMVDILTRKFPKIIVRIIDILKYIITMIFFAVVSRQVYLKGITIKNCGEVSETLQIIFYPFIFCVSMGFAILSFTILIDLIKSITKKEKKV